MRGPGNGWTALPCNSGDLLEEMAQEARAGKPKRGVLRLWVGKHHLKSLVETQSPGSIPGWDSRIL